MKFFTSKKLRILGLLSGLILLSTACSNSNNSPPTPTPTPTPTSTSTPAPAPDSALVRQSVTAAAGITVTTPDESLTLTIPAGALSTDTEIVITHAMTDMMNSESMVLLKSAYTINLGKATLAQPMQLQFALDSLPSHPELAETASYRNDSWSRVSTNFLRKSDMTVISLTDQAGTYQPMLRTLQKTSGDTVDRGRDIFLYETFGNEDFFGGVLGLHTLLSNISPVTAVGVGVQVDLARVPQAIVDVMLGDDFEAKGAALNDPTITVALLKADAVVGVKAVFESADSNVMTSAGITCALCHTNVTPTEFELSAGELTALPIGALQLDGIPNLSMDAGTILSLTPFVQAAGQELIDTMQGWGPGAVDVRALPDNVLEDNIDNPTSISPIWNFVDLDSQGYLYNWDGLFTNGSTSKNALASQAEAVYDLVMHANGAFGTGSGSIAPSLSITPPQALLDALQDAEDATLGNVIPEQSLLDVQAWQRSITSPAPGEYDEKLAETGFMIFHEHCAGCHSSPEFAGPGLFTTITIEAPSGGLADGVKTPGLRGIAKTAPYFSDSSAATLMDVMNVYSGRVTDVLSTDDKMALVEYMKSL